MDYYQIKWSKSARKELRKIDRKFIPKLIETVDKLAKDPYPQEVKKMANSDNNY